MPVSHQHVAKQDESQSETDLRQSLRGMKQAQGTARPLLRCADVLLFLSSFGGCVPITVFSTSLEKTTPLCERKNKIAKQRAPRVDRRKILSMLSTIQAH